jgi:hypothetical protein
LTLSPTREPEDASRNGPGKEWRIEISGITRDGMPVDYKMESIKGAVHAMFPVESGTHQVSYDRSQTADANPDK